MCCIDIVLDKFVRHERHESYVPFSSLPCLLWDGSLAALLACAKETAREHQKQTKTYII